MEASSTLHLERGGPVRPSVHERYQYRYEQRFTTRRLFMDAIRFAADANSRWLRTILRSRSLARSRKCAFIERKYDCLYGSDSSERESFARADRSARLPRYSWQPTAECADEFHDDEPEYAECIFRAGQS